MRLAPVLWTLMLAAAVPLGGYGVRTVVQEMEHAPSAVASPPDQVEVSVRSGAFPLDLRVPHLQAAGPGPGRERPRPVGSPSSFAGEIEREIAAVRDEWETRRREMASNRAPSATLDTADGFSSPPEPVFARVTEPMLDVERKYAPQFLNCRLRVRLLEARLAEAVGNDREYLSRRLEEAGASLAKVEAAYAGEMELARLETEMQVSEPRTADARVGPAETRSAAAEETARPGSVPGGDER